MAHAISNRTELERWLSVTLGERDDIFRFASTHLGLTPEQVAELPRGESPAATVHGLVTFLEQRGLTDALWPALLSAFPTRTAEVQTLLGQAGRGPGHEIRHLKDLIARYRTSAVGAWSVEPLPIGRPTHTFMPMSPIGYTELTVRLDVEVHRDQLTPEEHRLFFAATDATGPAAWTFRALLDEDREDRHKTEDPKGMELLSALPLVQTLERGGSWVLLGDPGSGKTTALRHLAARAAARPDGPLPVFARLEQVKIAEDDPDPVATLKGALASQVAGDLKIHELMGGLGRLLDAGPVLLLLDGLDECGDREERERVGVAVSQLLGQLPEGSQLIATSRVVGYREARLPHEAWHVRITALADEQMEALARRWFAGQPARRNRALAETFLAAIRPISATRQLAETPLLLTYLMRLYSRDCALPEVRAGLYCQLLEDFLQSWPKVRSPSRHKSSERAERRFELHLMILEHLAHQFHEGGGGSGHSGEEVKRLIERFVRKEEPDIKLDKLRNRTNRIFRELTQDRGALGQHGGTLRQRGRDHYSFQHRTFQEFLVGRALAEQEGGRHRAVDEHLDDPRWREPLLLCAGWLSLRWGDTPKAAELVLQVLDAGRTDDDMLHARLLFAADMLVELSSIYRENLGAPAIERVVRELTALLDGQQPAPLVAEVLRRLCGLARARDAHAIAALVDAMRRPPPPVRDHGFEVDIGRLARETVSGLLQVTDAPELIEALLNHHECSLAGEMAGVVFALAPRQPRALAVALDWLGPSMRQRVKPETVPHHGDTRGWPEALRRAHRDYALWRLDASGWLPPELKLHAADCEPARERMLQVLREPESHKLAANAAQALEPAAHLPEVRRALLETLRHDNIRARGLAATSLRGLASDDAEVRAALLTLVAAPEAEPRRAALEVLLQIGPRPDLLEALGRELLDGQSRRLVVSMLVRPTWPADLAVARLVSALRDPAPEVRQAAAQQAREWGLPGGRLPADLLSPLLATLQGDSNDLARAEALRTLSCYPSSSQDVRVALGHQLAVEELPGVAATAVLSVLPMVGNDQDVFDGVQELADHPLPEVRRAVARALSGVARDQGRTTLLALLDDPDDDTRAQAATALSQHLDDDEFRAALLGRADDLVGLKCKAAYELLRATPQNRTLRQALRRGIASPYPLRAGLIALAALPTGDDLLADARARLERIPALVLLSEPVWFDVEAAAPRIAEICSGRRRDTFGHTYPPTLTAVARHSARICEMLRLNLRDAEPHDDDLLAAARAVQARACAVQALAASEDRADLQALEPLWESDDPTLSAALILHLSPRAPWRAQVGKRWKRWLNSQHGSVRAALACALGRHPDLIKRPVQALRGLLLDPLCWVRAWAAHGLRRHLTRDPTLVDDLTSWLGASGRFLARDVGGPHFAHSAGVPMLEADDLRRDLADALAPHVAATPTLQEALEEMLTSPDQYARQGAAWTLWASGWERERLRPRLRGVLAGRRCTESVLLRVTAASAMISSLDRDLAARAHQTLLDALQTGQEPWRGEAQQALGATPTNIRTHALEALAETFNPVHRPGSLEAMRRYVTASDPRLRESAWRALRRVRDVEGTHTPQR